MKRHEHEKQGTAIRETVLYTAICWGTATREFPSPIPTRRAPPPPPLACPEASCPSPAVTQRASDPLPPPPTVAARRTPRGHVARRAVQRPFPERDRGRIPSRPCPPRLVCLCLACPPRHRCCVPPQLGRGDSSMARAAVESVRVSPSQFESTESSESFRGGMTGWGQGPGGVTSECQPRPPWRPRPVHPPAPAPPSRRMCVAASSRRAERRSPATARAARAACALACVDHVRC